MKINKNNLKEVLNIAQSFGHVILENEVKDNKVKLPKNILRYIEARLSNKNNKSAMFKNKEGQFYIEFFNNSFFLTRVLEDGRETKVLLFEEDLNIIKNNENITVDDVEALVHKVNYIEKRFGL
jgi:hypothetical protein